MLLVVCLLCYKNDWSFSSSRIHGGIFHESNLACKLFQEGEPGKTAEELAREAVLATDSSEGEEADLTDGGSPVKEKKTRKKSKGAVKVSDESEETKHKRSRKDPGK